MWNNKWLVIAAFCFGILGSGLAVKSVLSEKKLAYVNMKEVFEKFRMKQELQQKFEAEDLSVRKYLDSMAFVLTEEGNKLSGATDANQTEVQNYLRRKDAYLTQRNTYEAQRQELTAQYDNQIVTRMTQYVKDYGTEHGYDYIFGDDGNGHIMYAGPADNVTQEVITYLNNRFEGK